MKNDHRKTPGVISATSHFLSALQLHFLDRIPPLFILTEVTSPLMIDYPLSPITSHTPAHLPHYCLAPILCSMRSQFRVRAGAIALSHYIMLDIPLDKFNERDMTYHSEPPRTCSPCYNRQPIVDQRKFMTAKVYDLTVAVISLTS